jgi:hypothetical protein
MFATWMGDRDNPVINMRTVVSGPLRLRSTEPLEQDIQLFKKALAAAVPPGRGDQIPKAYRRPSWLPT